MAGKGFADWPRERLLEVARMGGKALKPEQRSFSKNKDLARAAGKKGGHAVSAEKRVFSTNRALAAESGKKGGEASRDKK